MASKQVKQFGKPLIVGATVVLGTPLIAGFMPAALAIPLVVGLDVGGLVSAALASAGGEMIAEWLF